MSLNRDTVIEIPPVPASSWLTYLLTSEPDLDALVNDLMPELEEYYFENDLSYNAMFLQVLDILSSVSARSWWIAFRLISVATNSWHVIGPRLMTSGIDATQISLAAWLDAVLLITMENMEPKHATMFTLQLEAPLPKEVMRALGTEIEQEEITMDRSAFMAMA